MLPWFDCCLFTSVFEKLTIYLVKEFKHLKKKSYLTEISLRNIFYFSA